MKIKNYPPTQIKFQVSYNDIIPKDEIEYIRYLWIAYVLGCYTFPLFCQVAHCLWHLQSSSHYCTVARNPWWVMQTFGCSKLAKVLSWSCWLGPFPSAYSSFSKLWPSTSRGIQRKLHSLFDKLSLDHAGWQQSWCCMRIDQWISLPIHPNSWFAPRSRCSTSLMPIWPVITGKLRGLVIHWAFWFGKIQILSKVLFRITHSSEPINFGYNKLGW